MASFDENQHPRATTGTFTDKNQSAPEMTLASNTYADQEPPQIDAVLAKLHGHLGVLHSKIARERTAIEQITSGKRSVSLGTTKELAIEVSSNRIAELNVDVAAVKDLISPIDEEFAARGGWSRFFVTTGSNPHVHASMACSTCYPTTQFGWLTDHSGMDETEIVELAGDEACTVCFPSAPVADRNAPRQNRLETPEGRAAREKRDAEKAARDAKKAAAAITAPNGDPIYDDSNGRFNTERAAEQAAVGGLVDIAWYGDKHPSAPGWLRVAADVEDALAAKRGVGVDVVRASWSKKLHDKLKRDGATSMMKGRADGVFASIDAYKAGVADL